AGSELSVTSGADDYVLFAVFSQSECHRRRLRACRKPPFPQLLSCLNVKRAHEIVHGRGDEDDASCGDNAAAEVYRSPLGGSRCGGQVRNRAERYLPPNLPARHINRRKRPPGWRIARRAAGTEKHFPV